MLNEYQKQLVGSLLLHASTVGVQDAIDGHYEYNDDGNTFEEVLSEKEFSEVADAIRDIIDKL